MLNFVLGALLAATLAAAITALPTGEAVAQASSPYQIVGVWEAENGSIKLEIFDAGGSYAARMI